MNYKENDDNMVKQTNEEGILKRYSLNPNWERGTIYDQEIYKWLATKYTKMNKDYIILDVGCGYGDMGIWLELFQISVHYP